MKSGDMFATCSCFFYVIFFFSSRRRHTRSLRDWSSDVCSSDLLARSASTPCTWPSVLPIRLRIPWERLNRPRTPKTGIDRSEEHTSELQSRRDLVCRLLLEKKNK